MLCWPRQSWVKGAQRPCGLPWTPFPRALRAQRVHEKASGPFKGNVKDSIWRWAVKSCWFFSSSCGRCYTLSFVKAWEDCCGYDNGRMSRSQGFLQEPQTNKNITKWSHALWIDPGGWNQYKASFLKSVEDNSH